MRGYQYSKIQTEQYLTGQFIIDVPHWDGEQPEDANIGITDKQPIPGCHLHVFDEDTQTWGEGKPQTEIDAIKTEQALAQCIAQRKARYKEESDPLYLDIVYDAEKTGVKPDLTTWVALKDRIKLEIPKP